MIYKEENTVKNIEKCQKPSIVIKGNTMTIAMIYRPVYSKKKTITFSKFIEDLAQCFQDILMEHTNIVILEHLNLHLETDDPDVMVFLNMVDAMGLIPHVNIPTYKADRTLDTVYTVLDSQVAISEFCQGLLLSNNFVIEYHALITRNSTATKIITSRKFKNIEYTVFMNDIKAEVIRLTSAEEAVRTLDAELWTSMYL